MVTEDGPQIGLEMNRHEIGDAFWPIHSDAQTVTHGATCSITGDDIAAADPHQLAGCAI